MFVALFFAGDYGPLSPASDGALLFIGGSMLLAALKGYPGCEILAVGNWVLGRRDRVGCAVLFPVDRMERVSRG